MTYHDSEDSLSSGAPLELYDFAAGATHWRYVSAEAAVTYLTNTFEPVAITRSQIEVANDPFKNDMEVSVSRTNDFAARYIAGPVESRVMLTIYRGHGENFIVLWKGFVAAVSFDQNVAKIKCSPITISLQRAGLGRRYQRLCTHALYSSGCTVNSEAYKESGTLSNVQGLVLTSAIFAGHADGWWIAGKIKIGDGIRLITAHTGSQITISHAIVGLQAGAFFYVWAGCDHSLETCRDKYANKLNYGGQPWIPAKNPFVGDGIA